MALVWYSTKMCAQVELHQARPVFVLLVVVRFKSTQAARAASKSSNHMLAALPVQEAATTVGRRVTLLRRGGAAADHPLDPACPEGEYLTNLLFRVM